ncbi:MAG: undecaprenyl-diphosphate phosphatase [Paracoccaceae bacterium]
MISFHIFFIAIIQGITEFLPISSSAHLIILPYLIKVSDQGVIIDISVHLGSLLALLIYFKKDSLILLKGLMQFFLLKFQKKEFFLFFKIIVATIPVSFIGIIFKIYHLDIIVRSIEIIGWTMIVFGVLLYYADKFGKEKKTLENLSFRDAIIMGLFQALALIPGVSRSGVTITGFRIFGYSRYDAIKISLLMSIPTIILSGFFIYPEVLNENKISFFQVLIPFVISFFTAIIALNLMVKYIYIFRFTPYVIYRIVLGFILLYISYF